MVIASIGIGWVVLIFIGGMILFFFLLGRFTSGTGAELLDWDPAGHADRRRTLDDEDTKQLLEMKNRQRREHGLPELTEDDIYAGADLAEERHSPGRGISSENPPEGS